jgi:hypothetical protein
MSIIRVPFHKRSTWWGALFLGAFAVLAAVPATTAAAIAYFPL